MSSELYNGIFSGADEISSQMLHNLDAMKNRDHIYKQLQEEKLIGDPDREEERGLYKYHLATNELELTDDYFRIKWTDMALNEVDGGRIPHLGFYKYISSYITQRYTFRPSPAEGMEYSIRLSEAISSKIIHFGAIPEGVMQCDETRGLHYLGTFDFDQETAPKNENDNLGITRIKDMFVEDINIDSIITPYLNIEDESVRGLWCMTLVVRNMGKSEWRGMMMRGDRGDMRQMLLVGESKKVIVCEYLNRSKEEVCDAIRGFARRNPDVRQIEITGYNKIVIDLRKAMHDDITLDEFTTAK